MEPIATYSFDRALVDGEWTIDAHALCSELYAQLPALNIGLTGTPSRMLVSVFADKISDEDAATIADVVATHVANTSARAIAKQKSAKLSTINARTRDLISAGFEYPPGSGKMFSLSETAQRNLSELNSIRDSNLVSYPFYMSTIDDSEVVSIPDSATVFAMYVAGLGAIQASYASGNALKLAVNASATKAELDAIVDNR